MHGASSSPGIHPFSQPHRGRRAGRQARPRDPRQLCRPQASQSARLARSASTLDLSFHTHFLLLGQCDREFLRLTHPSPPATRCLPLARRSTSRDQPLPQRAQPQTQALRLDDRSRPHHRKAEPWVSGVGVKPLACCSDFSKSNKVGDLRKESIAEALANKARAEMLEVFRTKQWCQKDACSRCRWDDNRTIQSIVRTLLLPGESRERNIPARAFFGVPMTKRDPEGNIHVDRQVGDGIVIYGPYQCVPPGRYRIVHFMNVIKTL